MSPTYWSDAFKEGQGEARQLDGSYENRTDAERKCYEAANERGWSLFTVSDGGACNSGQDAIYTYAAKGYANCYISPGVPNKESAAVYIIPGKQFQSWQKCHTSLFSVYLIHLLYR